MRNPGFATAGPGGSLEGWDILSEGTGTGRGTVESGERRHSVRLIRDTIGDYTMVRQRLAGYVVDPSRDYVIRGEYSTTTPDIAHPCVYYIDKDGKFLGAYECTLPATSGIGSFTRLFRPNPKAWSFEVQLRAQGKIGEVTYFGCDMAPAPIDPASSQVKLAESIHRETPEARCVLLTPGAELTVTLLSPNGVELGLSSVSLKTGLVESASIVSVQVNDALPIQLSPKANSWMRIIEPNAYGGKKTVIRLMAPNEGNLSLVCLRPVGNEYLPLLGYEFAGWEAGNFGLKSRWIGSSEKMIKTDQEHTMAMALTQLPGPFIVENSLTKPSGMEIIQSYVLDQLAPLKEARLKAAKGESESFQVIFPPHIDGKPVMLSEVVFSPLKSGDGNTIPSSAGHIFRMGYVDSPWGERIPDPLFKDLSMGDPRDPVVLLVDVRVPPDAKAGQYKGALELRVDGGKISVPVSLQVRDFVLPVESHFRTCFWFFRAQIKRHYGMNDDPTFEEYSPYLDMALRYRLTPIDCNEGNVEPLFKVYKESDGTFTVDWSDFDRFVDRVISQGGNVVHLAPTQWSCSIFSDRMKDVYDGSYCINRATGKREDIRPPYLSAEHKKMLAWYLKEAVDHCEKKGWLKYAYVQPFDEVQVNDEVAEILRTCREADPRVKVLMDVLSPAGAGLARDLINIWCPLSPNLPDGGFDAMRQRGDEVWWYVCCVPRKPYANIFTNGSMTEHRQLFWQSWKYRSEGLLYWGINYWNWWGGEKPYDLAASWPYGPWASNTSASDNMGDGYLIYPGPDKQPLPSLRLQGVLDGMEDYEYLWLLNDRVKQAEKKGVPESDLKTARDLLAIPETFCKSLTEYSRSPEELNRLRDSVASEIEKLSR